LKAHICSQGPCSAKYHTKDTCHSQLATRAYYGQPARQSMLQFYWQTVIKRRQKLNLVTISSESVVECNRSKRNHNIRCNGVAESTRSNVSHWTGTSFLSKRTLLLLSLVLSIRQKHETEVSHHQRSHSVEYRRLDVNPPVPCAPYRFSKGSPCWRSPLKL
jgi:hypothetical protein